MSDPPNDGYLRNLIRSEVVDIVPNWVWAVGDRGQELLRNPRNAVLTIVIGFVVDQLLFPIFRSIATIGLTIVDAVTLLFFGTDRTLSATGQLGLADIPLYASSIVIGGAEPVVLSVVGFVLDLNQQVGEVAASAGFAGFPIAAGLAVAEVGVLLYVTWSLVEIIDVPLIELDGILQVALYPFRLVLGLIR